jgi:hypothetical protein
MAGDGTWATTLKNLKKAVGYREGKGNANKFSAGLGRPAEFWCADFAEYELKVSGVPRIGTSAYTPKVEAQYKKAGRLGTKPRVGAQFFLYSPAKGRVCHTGIVIALLSGNRVRTIEGNTNNDGSDNGDGVYVRIRPAKRPALRTGIRSYGYPRYTPAKKPAKPAPNKTATIKAVQKLLGDLVADGDLGPKTQARFSAVRSRCQAHRQANHTLIANLQRAVGLRPLPSPGWGVKTDAAFHRLGFRV